MATSLLALLDDMATILDDVAVLTKVAAKKSAGVLGDDLALNAQQVAGVAAARELPVVWQVAKGSLLNKAILVPAALAVSAAIPWAVTPLLMLGGAFLCFEGVEKLAEKFFHRDDHAHHKAKLHAAVANPAVDLVALEKDKIKGAVRTDFVLSAEIIAITLAAVSEAPFLTQVGVLVAIALLMTAGVYGFVAGIVKLDDAGVYLSKSSGGGARAVGRAILVGAPWLMKGLGVAGTAAMFLVGGGILTHGVPPLHHAVEAYSHRAGGVVGALLPHVVDAVVGVVAGLLIGAVVVGGALLVKKLSSKR